MSMIVLFGRHLFYGKKRMLYMLGICLICLMMVFIGYTKDPLYVQLLYQRMYQDVSESMGMKMLSITSLFMVALFVMDHDQQTYKILIPYVSRTKIIGMKMIGYHVLFLLFISFLYLFWNGSLMVLTHYYTYNQKLIGIFIHFFMDAQLLLIAALLWVKNDKQNRMIFILLLFLCVPMIQEDLKSNVIFYILPVYYSEIKLSFLMVIYKIMYILCGLMGLIQFYEKCDISC